MTKIKMAENDHKRRLISNQLLRHRRKFFRKFTRMIKLSTTVSPQGLVDKIGLDDRITLLGSCFVDNIASHLCEAGFTIQSNPFGTLYNPASIANAIELLDSTRSFEEKDCIQMGAGSKKICSFYHHTSFAKDTVEEFLDYANYTLCSAREEWNKSDYVIITLGTAFVWTHNGKIVSNCLKRPAYEFEHRLLSLSEIKDLIEKIITSHPEKRFIFTISPIRHLGEGARSNTISKSLLHIALNECNVEYFPAYEILLDELRDYRFYAEDLVHPSKIAVQIIWEKFLDYALKPEEFQRIAQNEKNAKSAKHVRRI